MARMSRTTQILEQLNKDKKKSRRIQNQVDFAKALSTEAAIAKRGRNA